MFLFQTNKKTEDCNSETGEAEIFSMSSPLRFIELFFSRGETGDNDGKSEDKRYVWYILGLTALISLNIIFFTWKEMPESSEERLKRLMANKDYHYAFILCNDLLSESPKNASSLYKIATEAMVKDIMNNGWNERITKGLFTDARILLKDAEEYSKYNPEGLKAIEFLNWITELEEYFFKAEPETPVVIFRDEARIAYFLTRWNENRNYIRQLLTQVFSQTYTASENNADKAEEQDNDEARLTHHRIYNHLYVLQNQKNLYFGVIQDLKNNIQKEIDSENPDSAISAIAEFKRKFPGVGGLNLLEADASNYIELSRAVKSERWSQIPKLFDKIQFQTELFVDNIDRLLKSHEKLNRTREIFKQKREDNTLLSKLKF